MRSQAPVRPHDPDPEARRGVLNQTCDAACRRGAHKGGLCQLSSRGKSGGFCYNERVLRAPAHYAALTHKTEGERGVAFRGELGDGTYAGLCSGLEVSRRRGGGSGPRADRLLMKSTVRACVYCACKYALFNVPWVRVRAHLAAGGTVCVHACRKCGSLCGSNHRVAGASATWRCSPL